MNEITEEQLAILNEEINGNPEASVKKGKRRFSIIFYVIVAVLIVTTLLSIIAFKRTERQLGLNAQNSPYRTTR